MQEFRNKKTGDQWEALQYVDATPDKDYPLRILRAHYENATTGDWVADPPSPMITLMNQIQEERAKILNSAINTLLAFDEADRATFEAIAVEQFKKELREKFAKIEEVHSKLIAMVGFPPEDLGYWKKDVKYFKSLLEPKDKKP